MSNDYQTLKQSIKFSRFVTRQKRVSDVIDLKNRRYTRDQIPFGALEAINALAGINQTRQ